MSSRHIIVVAVTVIALVAGVRAQQSAAVDPIRELLAEVRGLRAAMERAATVGARVQLLVARIQLQEQRIAELSRRATELRSEQRNAELELGRIAAMHKQFEAAADIMPESERKNFEHQLTMMKTQAATLEKRGAELAQEEGFLAQQLAQEQGRWTAINDQLDALERSLIIK